jgi:hypothetical protein
LQQHQPLYGGCIIRQHNDKSHHQKRAFSVALQLMLLVKKELLLLLRLTVLACCSCFVAACSGYKFEALCTGGWQHHA